eukprot:TRINITY_DN646_c0_g1_i1.p1 TRINITY_DN646_c0_g1~~TRINITY_DN646_c0_g1_i1.p1  ORF type:complete len:206 (-),score=49.20 TRINITY_DN646_c0_g1_i1:213-830(-)
MRVTRVTLGGGGHGHHHHGDGPILQWPGVQRTAKPLTNHQRVTRLYRQALRTSRDWYFEIDEWEREIKEIRGKFEASKGLTNPVLIEEKINEAKKMLKLYQNPTPYIKPEAPGGTKWQRNIQPPSWALNPRNHRTDFLAEVFDDPLDRSGPKSPPRPGYGEYQYLYDEFLEEEAHEHHAHGHGHGDAHGHGHDDAHGHGKEHDRH